MACATAIEQDGDYRSRRRLNRNFLPAIASHSADHSQDRFGHDLKVQIAAYPPRSRTFFQRLANQQRELSTFPPILSSRPGRQNRVGVAHQNKKIPALRDTGQYMPHDRAESIRKRTLLLQRALDLTAKLAEASDDGGSVKALLRSELAIHAALSHPCSRRQFIRGDLVKTIVREQFQRARENLLAQPRYCVTPASAPAGICRSNAH